MDDLGRNFGPRQATGREGSSRSTESRLSQRLSSLLSLKRKPSDKAPRPPRPKNDFGLVTVFEPGEDVDVIADFVFVHGLGGGSSTTWCLKQNSEYFWPKEWLPRDPDFEGVRVHSFGYNANWATWLNSPADVHAFGQSLVEELHSNPHMRGQNSRIVLIGHSMGGLVIKKACILAKTVPDFRSVAERLHSFYFLGTPHRGSNLAKTLNNLLSISGTGRRAYVAGLQTKSEMIRVLSDQFRHSYSGIHLHTFYETKPMHPVGMIVDLESATLGYAEERAQLMNANHRDLAKFENAEDSNYRSLRNRLATTVQQIREENTKNKEVYESSTFEPAPPPDYQAPLLFQDLKDQVDAIGAYLSIDHSPEDDLSTLDDMRLKGSCSWLTNGSSFHEWRESHTPRYFWLKGPPACGKSMLSSHVVDVLKDSPSCYYYFKSGERTSPNLSAFLRSMAYQMARVNGAVREALFELSTQGPPIDVRNTKSIWHNVFIGCIFHHEFQKPHYWVVDALDEAAERGPLDEYFLLLSKIDENIPLKIFITSRPSHVLDTLFAQLPTITQLVTSEDSLVDIRLYVETWSAGLPVDDSAARERLADAIVEKSGGSFLWTVLVMKQLREVITDDEVHQVLEEVPQEMGDLYRHNIRRIESSRSKNLAKHILMWAVCSIHLLTVDQMKDAIKLSLNTNLARDLKSSLQHICGQFLEVNSQSRIQLVHDTARAFLTSYHLDSELRIDLPEGHGMIATACLKYLMSDELKHTRRRRSSAAVAASRTSIADYACLRFSEHIHRASSSSDELHGMLAEFFKTNVLSWIECVAQLNDLDCLIRTSRHLSKYLARRTKYVPFVLGDLQSWVVDLPRIVTQFGVNLLDDPGAIHTLVPPFCPRESAVFRNFGYAEDGIKLVGAWSSGWDDRVCSVSFHGTYATAVACRDKWFAVGLSDGRLKMYKTSTCEELMTLSHEESISVLKFASTYKLMGSAGLRHVRLWDTTTGKQLFEITTASQTLSLGFNEGESLLMVSSRDKQLTVFQISDGRQLYKLPWTDNFIDPKDSGFGLSPNTTRVSFDQQAMAVVYRSKPVQLWSLESQRPIGACIRQALNKHASANHVVNSLAFHPNSACPYLLVAYWDELVVVFDINTCKPLSSTAASIDKLAIAPNGKTFAGSDGSGAIKVYDFETLQFLHRIPVQDDPVTSMVFTSDSLRIIDVRTTQANVWEPAVLVSQDMDSHSSEPSESVHQAADDLGVTTIDQSSIITFLYCCEDSGIAICGRSNGRVDTCNLDDPEKTMRNLYNHRGGFTSVTCLDWSYKARIAASADSSGVVRVMQIRRGARREWSAELLFEARLEHHSTAAQVLIHPSGSFLLVSSLTSDSVWSVADKKRVALVQGRKRTAWKWFIRPASSSQLLLFEDRVLKLCNWNDLQEVTISDDIQSLARVSNDKIASPVDSDAISISSEGDDLVFVQRIHRSQSKLITSAPQPINTTINVFDLSFLEASLESPVLQAQDSSAPEVPWAPRPAPPVATSSKGISSIRNVADIPNVDSVIGTVKKFNSWFLIFISRQGWVCSVELSSRKPSDTFQKHFFIPVVWRTGNASLITKVRRNQEIIFVHNDGIIVVKNGLDIGEYISLF